MFALFAVPIARYARRQFARTYQNIDAIDPRPPILYLRPFSQDDQPLSKARHGVLPKLVLQPGAASTLDQVVLEAAAPYGPVIAIGRPDEPLPPLGAARRYVGDNADWRRVVQDLCQAASAIVLCYDATSGVRWELEHVVAAGHAEKTLLLVSPSLPKDQRQDLASLLGLSPQRRRRLVGAGLGPEDMAYVALHLSASAYAAALNAWLEKKNASDAQAP